MAALLAENTSDEIQESGHRHPGVLGSRLVTDEGDTSVWGEWQSRFTDPATDAGRRLISLPMELGKPLDELQSCSHADSTLGRVRGSVIGVPVSITAYGGILSALGVESYAETFVQDRQKALSLGDVAFEFSYDWRRSLDESAIAFEIFQQRAAQLLQVRRQSIAPIKFDVVAHSMGGRGNMRTFAR